MPTYDYHCDACEHDFEEFQSFSDATLTKCPKCGKKKLRRLFGTGAGIIFKGSGFYETDYRSDSYKEAAKADKEKSSGSTDKSGDAGKSTDKTGTTAAKAPVTQTKKAAESGKSPKSAPGKSDD